MTTPFKSIRQSMHVQQITRAESEDEVGYLNLYWFEYNKNKETLEVSMFYPDEEINHKGKYVDISKKEDTALFQYRLENGLIFSVTEAVLMLAREHGMPSPHELLEIYRDQLSKK